MSRLKMNIGRQLKCLVVTMIVCDVCVMTCGAGTGTIKDKKSDISVMFLFQDADVQAWENLFNEASQALFDATDGQLQFGTIRFFLGRMPKFDKDIYVMDKTKGAFAKTGKTGSSSKGDAIYYPKGYTREGHNW